MRAGIVVNVTRADRHRLEAIVSDRSAPQKHVWRANIILATAEGCGTAEIMRRSGKSKPVVWRWQARFMAEGVEGLTRDKTRKPGKQPLPTGTVQRVVDLALGPPPGEATRWTGRMLAKAAGVGRAVAFRKRVDGTKVTAPVVWTSGVVHRKPPRRARLPRPPAAKPDARRENCNTTFM
jgi:hypothetical protein